MDRIGSKAFAILTCVLLAVSGSCVAASARDRDHGGGRDGGSHETHVSSGHDGFHGDRPGGDARHDNARHDGGHRDGPGWSDRRDGRDRDRHDDDRYGHGWHDRGSYDRGWHDRGWHDRGGWYGHRDRYWRPGYVAFVPFPRISVNLRAFGFYGWWDDPFWYGERYVVRCYDRYGRLVYVEINPYTGDYIGVLDD